MSETKESFLAEDRTFCDHCGNSDVEMNDIYDELCYDCLHPEETAYNARLDIIEHQYVYGDADCPF